MGLNKWPVLLFGSMECYTLILEFLVYLIQLVTNKDKELIWMLGG